MLSTDANVVALSAPLVEADFDPALNALWISMTIQRSRPQNFSNKLLQALQGLINHVCENQGLWGNEEGGDPIHYAVLRSRHPNYFNLGGDLNYFLDCIRRGDPDSLRNYSMQCLDMIYQWATAITRQSTTIALVQGRALGGGFETALSADYIVAEEHAEFGFPEILFGLFPCTGGMSLLARRIGVYEAEKIMRNGKIYSAIELEEIGIIDRVCPSGTGESAIGEFIIEHSKRRKARQALQHAKARMTALNYEELNSVVNDWVAAAMCLTDNELRVLETLVKMQRSEFAH
ncbi:putative Enoyl-CoA hydratase/carnithine racemase [Thiomonas sp. X19]|uniref:crotonase/enoyl-CoA hydratase family protein n=1 Tax=Thiomonas sp. X19 TaxID=1050370 RepID=UPI000B746EC5|nr:crotonase/enoyl-CoA hydratase family protein [Thiomonas sp. X19]SCC94260.1 putative Enoyl-CoA hydratase/carnithine racemase [Thiomonas sp. X19]